MQTVIKVVKITGVEKYIRKVYKNEITVKIVANRKDATYILEENAEKLLALANKEYPKLDWEIANY
jgi:hypothetical protein